MRLRFHSSDMVGGRGAFIFECPPQQRSIFSIYDNTGPKRLWFPWVIFAIRYCKPPVLAPGGRSYVPGKFDPGFLFGGVYDSGLGVYFRNKPLESFDDPLFHSPTDYGRNGIVCTDHRFDRMICDSAEEVAGTVLDIWWNSSHYICYPAYPTKTGSYSIGDWPKHSLEEVLKQKWLPVSGTLRSLIPLAADVEMVDEAPPSMPSRFFGPAKKEKK